MTRPSWSGPRSSCAPARSRPRTGEHEHLIALDGKTYDRRPEMCVIADAGGERPIGLGGVMGGESTGCSDDDHRRLPRERLVRPDRTAQTGRDDRHHLRRPVPLRPRRRSGLGRPRPGTGHPPDPRPLRRRAVRDRRRRRGPGPPAAVRLRPGLCRAAVGPATSAATTASADPGQLGFVVQALAAASPGS